jgi:hypothetical protein
MFRAIITAVLSYHLLISGASLGDQPVTTNLPLASPMAVAYSPNGKQIAVGGIETVGNAPNDGLVVLVDANSGEQRATLRHSGTIKLENGSSSSTNLIYEMAFSPDGRILAVASDLGLKLWNPLDGKEFATLLGYGLPNQTGFNYVKSVAYSPAGTIMTISRSPGTIEFWDVQSRGPIREIDAGSEAHLAFSSDGSLLVSAEHHNRVHLWDVKRGQQLAEVHAEMGPLYGVAIATSGKLVAAVGEGGEKMWRIEKTGSGDWRFMDEFRFMGQAPMGAVRGVAFSPDGKLLATFSDNSVTILYDTTTKSAVGVLWSGGPSAFSPNGQRLAVAENVRRRPATGSQLSIWNVADVLSAERLAEQARMAASELVRALSSGQRDDLYNAHPRALAVLGGPQAAAAAPILIEALANREIKQKDLIGMALGRVANESPAAVTALAKAIAEDESADTRTAAAIALSMISPAAAAPAVPALVAAATKDDSPHVRSAAGGVLQRVDPAAYRQVAEQARARGPVESKVVKRDGQFYYQGRSLDEWIQRLSVSFVPNEIFGRPRPDEPLAAIRAIGVDAVPMLAEKLQNGQWQEQQAAAAGLEALGSSAGPAINPLLDAIANATLLELRLAGSAADAVAAILKQRNEPPARLIEMTKSNDPAVRLSAARAVAQLGPNHPRGLSVLKAALAASSNIQSRPYLMMGWGPIAELPAVSWLEKVVADNEAPAMERIRAAETLARMNEGALPALAALIKAAGADDADVSYQASRAIQRIGPPAIPAVSEAFKAETNARTRQRLAVALWGLGDEGRRALDGLVQGDEAEALWWAAALGASDPNASMSIEVMVREALVKCGQPVERWPRPKQPSAVRPNLPTLEKPTVAWSAKVLVDDDAPRMMRFQAATALHNAPPSEISPVLPMLMDAMNKEQDRAMQSQFANVIQRLGSQAIPAVKTGIEQAKSDYTRRELLRALSGLGTEGQQEFSRLMQINPEYSQLFSPDSKAAELEKNKMVHQAELEVQEAESDVIDFEVSLHGKQGQEIKGRVNTASDSFVITSWTDPQHRAWTPRKLPLTLYAFSTNGDKFDVPDDWNGKFAGWAFLPPVERDLLAIEWNEGTPNEFWKGSTFGWGGLRNRLGKVVAANGRYDESKRFRYVPFGNGRSTVDLSFEKVTITRVSPATTLKPMPKPKIVAPD